jgi:polysaccharide deacetylase family protein (PEP-CTERM system associated)
MNILTFDVEEWFHCDFISDNSSWVNYETRIYHSVDKILGHLSEKNQKGTFFILGWIADKYPDVVRKIKLENHEIGCHSYFHGLVHQMSKQEFYDDTEKAIKKIEDIIGEKVNIYRAPGFSITETTPWAFEILTKLGIEYDCSIFPASHDYGGFPSFGESEPAIINTKGIRIKEFPMNTHRFLNKNIVFSGGGFFRLFPYKIIKHWTHKSPYVMSYFHPRDFDYEQPMLPHLPLVRKFKSYYGLKNAFPKFIKWMEDFEFISLKDADSKIDWNKAKVINIHQ